MSTYNQCSKYFSRSDNLLRHKVKSFYNKSDERAESFIKRTYGKNTDGKIPTFLVSRSNDFRPDGIRSMETLKKMDELVNRPPVASPSYQEPSWKVSKNLPEKVIKSIVMPLLKSIMEYSDLKKPRFSSEELAKIAKHVLKPTQVISEPSSKQVKSCTSSKHPSRNVFLPPNVASLKEKLILLIDGF